MRARRPAIAAVALLAACSSQDPIVVLAPKPTAEALVAPAPTASASAPAPPNEPLGCFSAPDQYNGLNHAVWSPKGARLAIACEAGIEVMNIAGARRTVAASYNISSTIIGFREDGEALVFSNTFGIQLLIIATGAIKTLPLPPYPNAIALSPSFTLAIAEDMTGVMTLHDVAGGAALRTLDGKRSFGQASVAWSPDGQRVVTAASAVELWNAASGAQLASWRPPSGVELTQDRPLFTGDGATFFVRARRAKDGEGLVYAFDTATFARKGPWPAAAFAIADEGKTLFASHACKIKRIDTQSGSAKVLYHDTSTACEDYGYGALAASPDGNWLTAFLRTLNDTIFYAFDARSGARAPWR